MKTKFTIYHMLGSETGTDSEKGANDCFGMNLEATILQNNETGEIIKKREHKRCGTLRTGVRFIGNVKIFECSDTKEKITILGERLKDALKRFSKMEKNRQFDSFYDENN